MPIERVIDTLELWSEYRGVSDIERHVSGLLRLGRMDRLESSKLAEDIICTQDKLCFGVLDEEISPSRE